MSWRSLCLRIRSHIAVILTLRSGGRTMITFFFDSVFTWGVNVSVAWVLAYKTNMDIVPLYFCVQALGDD